MKCFSKAVTLDTLNADYQFELGSCYVILDRIPEAMAPIKTTESLEPGNAPYVIFLSMLLSDIDEDDER